MRLRHIHFETISSTNTWAKKHCFPNTDELIVVTADHQTHGRGRFDRTWVSPPNVNIYATYCLALPQTSPFLANIPQILALSAITTLEDLDINTGLKWPNDILLNEKKIAGILCEAVHNTIAINLYVGIGININMSSQDLNTIDRPATSLLAETNTLWDITSIITSLNTNFCNNISLFLASGFPHFLPQLQKKILHIGLPITITNGSQTHHGTLHTLNNDGSITLLSPHNTTSQHNAGEYVRGTLSP